jgi:hypothetical protein
MNALRWTFVAGVLLITGCHYHQVTWRQTTRDEMLAALTEHIPPGSSLEAAQKFLEREGFECQRVENDDFIEREYWTDIIARHEGVTYLHATRSQSDGHLLMSRTWDVAVVEDGDVVGEVLVSKTVDGP